MARESGSVRKIVRCARQRLVHRLQPVDLLPDAAVAAGQVLHLPVAGLAFLRSVDAHHLVNVARDIGFQMGKTAGDLVPGEVPVAVVHRLELAAVDGDPVTFWHPDSAAQLDEVRASLRMAQPFARRNSAMVLWSGTSRPVSHITSTFQPASRSRRRLDGLRFRQP